MTTEIFQQLNAKVSDLNKEIETLVGERDQLVSKINQIDTRLTQIVGAVQVLQEIMKKDEANASSFDLLGGLRNS